MTIRRKISTILFSVVIDAINLYNRQVTSNALEIFSINISLNFVYEHCIRTILDISEKGSAFELPIRVFSVAIVRTPNSNTPNRSYRSKLASCICLVSVRRIVNFSLVSAYECFSFAA